MKTTAKDIAALVTAGIEDEETPARFLAYLKTREGKKLTKRDLPALQAIDSEARFYSVAGMTSLEWGGYGNRRNSPKYGGSILLTYGDMVCDTAKIQRLNTCYWPAAGERNAERRKVLADTATLSVCADLINTINKARAALEAMVDYGGPLYVERTSIEKLVKS